ncbi:MAG: carbohydrate-binding family 9-like protein [Lentimicrobiaceae bacterium]|nr:carbohydrate-binding family 9-like protein [Lentimicrobiaceae bacterium]
MNILTLKNTTIALFLVFLFVQISAFAQSLPLNNLPYPETYICYRTDDSIIIDGKMDEKAWQKAKWTSDFVDIEGDLKPLPYHKTNVKMLWDDTYLYIAAFMEEPHVWATLTERESVIFHDNDFEVFIDPDGDTHVYLELELNAFNTQWDLLLLKPYRDETQNVAVDNWNINGLKTAVYVDGTINNPNDIDKGWYCEIAIPFDAIVEVNNHNSIPKNGDIYRVNFSRVQWITDIVNGKYVKRSTVKDGKKVLLPEHNWVWSPQGVIAMHQPETWGYLQFSDKIVSENNDEPIIIDPDFEVKKALRHFYYSQKEFFRQNKSFFDESNDIYKKLIVGEPILRDLKYCCCENLYVASLFNEKTGNNWKISQDGRIWIDNKD